MVNHNNVKFGARPLDVADLLRCRMHPSEVYEVVAIEAARVGIHLERVRLRQVRKPGARRRAKTDLIARAYLEESYEAVVR